MNKKIKNLRNLKERDNLFSGLIYKNAFKKKCYYDTKESIS